MRRLGGHPLRCPCAGECAGDSRVPTPTCPCGGLPPLPPRSLAVGSPRLHSAPTAPEVPSRPEGWSIKPEGKPRRSISKQHKFPRGGGGEDRRTGRSGRIVPKCGHSPDVSIKKGSPFQVQHREGFRIRIKAHARPPAHRRSGDAAAAEAQRTVAMAPMPSSLRIRMPREAAGGGGGGASYKPSALALGGGGHPQRDPHGRAAVRGVRHSPPHRAVIHKGLGGGGGSPAGQGHGACPTGRQAIVDGTSGTPPSRHNATCVCWGGGGVRF